MTLIGRLTSTLGDSRGSILAGGLMLVFVTTLLGLALLDLAVLDNRLVVGDDCAARALYAAEAGLQVAYRDLANGTAIGLVDFDGVVGDSHYDSRTNLPAAAYLDRTLSGSNAQATKYTVEARRNYPSAGTITLWSTGKAETNCPGGLRSVTVRGQVGKNSTAGGSGHSFVGADYFLTGGGGFLLDSFDSSKGSYDCLGGTANCTVPDGTRNKCQQTTPPFTCSIEIWTNGSATQTKLDGGPIYANVVSASGEVQVKTGGVLWGTLTYDTTDGSVTGATSNVKGGISGQAGIQPFNLPPVPWPGRDALGGGGEDCRTHPNGMPGSGPAGFSLGSYVSANVSGSYAYDEASGSFRATGAITINPLTGPAQFCFSEFLMQRNQLTVPNTVTNQVEIYIGSAIDTTTRGKANLDGNIINSTGQAKYLRVFSISNHESDDIWVTSGTGSYVFAYAPHGQVQVKGGGSFFGAAFGKNFSANGGSQVHFDKALLSIPGLPGLTGGSGGTVSFSLQNWKQCRDVSCA